MRNSPQERKNNIRPPAELTNKIMGRIKNLNTPGKKQKEMVRLVVKYFVMEHRPEELNRLNIFFDDIYQSMMIQFSPDLKIEGRQAALRSKGKSPQKLAGLQMVIETTYRIIQTITTQQLETEKKPLGMLETIANSLGRTEKERKLVRDLIKFIRRIYFG